MCLGLVDAQSLHEPAVLLGRKRTGFAFLAWPLEAATLQPFVQQYEAVALPVQRLDPIPPPSAEQKQRVAEWILFKFQLHQRRQAVDALPEVGVPAANVHLLGTCEVAQHDFIARSTASTVAASAPL